MVTKCDLGVLARLLRGEQFDIAVKIYRGVMDCNRETAEDFLRKMCADLKAPTTRKERAEGLKL